MSDESVMSSRTIERPYSAECTEAPRTGMPRCTYHGSTLGTDLWRMSTKPSTSNESVCGLRGVSVCCTRQKFNNNIDPNVCATTDKEPVRVTRQQQAEYGASPTQLASVSRLRTRRRISHQFCGVCGLRCLGKDQQHQPTTLRSSHVAAARMISIDCHSLNHRILDHASS
jgi:hypothetical protein